MHLASRTFALGSLILAALRACSSGGGGNGNGGSTATTTTTTTSDAMACADEAKAACTLRDTCSPGYNNKKVYGDEPTCETRTQLTCVTSLAAKGTGQTPAHIETCVMAYSTYACADFFDGNPPAACVPPMGTLANGTVCGASGQCTSTFCNIGPYQLCGTCEALPAAGAACQVQADCGRDQACAVPTAATAGVCAAFVASGGACLTGVNPCQAGLSCVGDVEATKTMGTCQKSGVMVGAACDGSRKTMPGCEANLGLVCIPTAKGSAVGTCQNVTWAASGERPAATSEPPPSPALRRVLGGRPVRQGRRRHHRHLQGARSRQRCLRQRSHHGPALPPARQVHPHRRRRDRGHLHRARRHQVHVMGHDGGPSEASPIRGWKRRAGGFALEALSITTAMPWPPPDVQALLHADLLAGAAELCRPGWR